MAVNGGSIYTASFNFKFASGSSFSGPLTVSLVGSNGQVLASSSKTISASTNWQTFSTTLTPTATAPNTQNTFQVTLNGASAAGETIYFALFSLFPPTFKGRTNGMRVDLAETLADMKPAFFRFPGGNNLVRFDLDRSRGALLTFNHILRK